MKQMQALTPQEGINFLLMFPRDPHQVSLEMAEQLLGLRPAPRLASIPPRRLEPRGVQVEHLDLAAWWNLALFLQGREQHQLPLGGLDMP